MELPDIAMLTGKQLKRLIHHAQERLATVEQEEADGAKEAIQRMIDDSGLDVRKVLSEMIDGMRKGKTPKLRVPARPKYRDLVTGDTWSGRGKPPAWMRAHLDDGKEKDAYLIHSEPQDEGAA
jgi:DNA-binding protein H-NS